MALLPEMFWWNAINIHKLAPADVLCFVLTRYSHCTWRSAINMHELAYRVFLHTFYAYVHRHQWRQYIHIVAWLIKLLPSLSLLHLLLASLSLIMSMIINFRNDKLYYWTPHPDGLTSINFVCVCDVCSCVSSMDEILGKGAVELWQVSGHNIINYNIMCST